MVLNNGHEVKRVKQKGDKTIPNNAVKQIEQEQEKGGDIMKKSSHRTTQLPKLIPLTKLMYSRARTVALWFLRVFRGRKQ